MMLLISMWTYFSQLFFCVLSIFSECLLSPWTDCPKDRLRSVAQTYLRPKLGHSFRIFMICRPNFWPIDMSSCQNIKFDMQNPILTSKIAQNWAHDRKFRPEIPKQLRKKLKNRPMFGRRIVMNWKTPPSLQIGRQRQVNSARMRGSSKTEVRYSIAER